MFKNSKCGQEKMSAEIGMESEISGGISHMYKTRSLVEERRDCPYWQL